MAAMCVSLFGLQLLESDPLYYHFHWLTSLGIRSTKLHAMAYCSLRRATMQKYQCATPFGDQSFPLNAGCEKTEGSLRVETSSC